MVANISMETSRRLVKRSKKYDSYRCWSCAELCEAFTFFMDYIYVQFDGMVYQQIVGIPMGTNCAPLIGWSKTHRISSRQVRLRRRQYDPLIVERTIGLVLGPSTALYRPFPKHCTLTNKAVGDYMTGLVQTSSEAIRS